MKNTIQIFENRNDLMRSLPKNSSIVEIGVFKGDFSKFIFNEMKPEKLILIDIFEGYVGSGDKDGNNMEYVHLQNEYEKISEYYKNFKNVQILKGFSKNLLTDLQNESIDIFYIDASHEYDDVKSDLNICYEKTKLGGYICGHDYVSPRFAGVVQAVDEFCKEKNLSINFLSKDGCPTFCIKKI